MKLINNRTTSSQFNLKQRIDNIDELLAYKSIITLKSLHKSIFAS